MRVRVRERVRDNIIERKKKTDRPTELMGVVVSVILRPAKEESLSALMNDLANELEYAIREHAEKRETAGGGRK